MSTALGGGVVVDGVSQCVLSHFLLTVPCERDVDGCVIISPCFFSLLPRPHAPSGDGAPALLPWCYGKDRGSPEEDCPARVRSHGVLSLSLSLSSSFCGRAVLLCAHEGLHADVALAVRGGEHPARDRGSIPFNYTTLGFDKRA